MPYNDINNIGIEALPLLQEETTKPTVTTDQSLIDLKDKLIQTRSELNDLKDYLHTLEQENYELKRKIHNLKPRSLIDDNLTKPHLSVDLEKALNDP